MRTHVLDTIARRASLAVSRRQSLLTLGSAALATAAIAPPEPAAAKKQGKDCQKKERQRCANDTEACRLTVLLNCEPPGQCGAAARCCEACTATGFANCVIQATA